MKTVPIIHGVSVHRENIAAARARLELAFVIAAKRYASHELLVESGVPRTNVARELRWAFLATYRTLVEDDVHKARVETRRRALEKSSRKKSRTR